MGASAVMIGPLRMPAHNVDTWCRSAATLPFDVLPGLCVRIRLPAVICDVPVAPAARDAAVAAALWDACMQRAGLA